jgi:hypothetical protein
MFMRYIISLLLLFASLFSCSYSTFKASVPLRDGPPFSETFPDATVLVKTTDVRATRKMLWSTPLPEVREHHDRLIAILEELPAIDTDHLLLLTYAVAVPGRLSREAHVEEGLRVGIITDSDGVQFVYTRAKGEFTPVIDELLLKGMKKLSDPDAANFGRLLGESQTTETMIALSDHLLETCDTGTDSDLQLMLEHLPFDEQCVDFATLVLLPRDRLEGERRSIALKELSFDSSREKLVTAVYDRLETVPVSMLLEHIELLDFDSARVSIANAASPYIESITGVQMLEMLANFSFDSGKVEAVDALNTKVTLNGFQDVLKIMETSSFDSGATQMLGLLLASSFPTITADDLGAVCNACSFETGQLETLRKLEPHFQGPFDGESARDLLDKFSFDSGKLECIQIFAEHMRGLSYEAQKSVLSTFSFDSDRESARDILNR